MKPGRTGAGCPEAALSAQSPAFPPQPAPAQFTRAVVRSVKDLAEGWQEADVGLPDTAFHDALLFGPLTPGQRVILNTTAVSLDLGTGGSHFVCWAEPPPEGPAGRGGIPLPPYPGSPGRSGPGGGRSPFLPSQAPEPLDRRRGHIMKLRYTPLQRRVLALEELDPRAGEGGSVGASGGTGGGREARGGQTRRDLGGMPVVVAGLHSQVAPAAAGIRSVLGPDAVILYVMTDGGSLPAGFSRTIRILTGLGIINGTVTAGHAYGGDYEAVTPLSALETGRRRLGVHAAIVAPGPGGAGTGSPFGFSALEQAGLADGVGGAGGRTISCLRVSFADPRPRHYGVSHHSITALKMTARPAFLALPRDVPESRRDLLWEKIRCAGLHNRHFPVETRGAGAFELLTSRLGMEGAQGLLTTMGRTASEDPAFFTAAAAAGRLAGKLVSIG